MKRMKKLLGVCLLSLGVVVGGSMETKAWVSDNGDGTFTNPVMWGDYPDNDIIRVGDTYYMSSTSMHLFPGCPIMSSKDLVNWEYESYALSEEDALRLAKNDDGLTLKNGRSVYDQGPWATSLRYSEKLKKFYLLVNQQDGVDSEYAILCVADKASGPWKAYRLDNPEGKIKGLYDPGLLFDKDPKTGKENGDIYVVHGQGELFVTKLKVVDEKTGELAIDDTVKNKSIYDYKGGGYNEGSHAYKIGDTYYIISTPTWSGTGTKKSIAIQTKNLLNGPYEVKDIMRSYMNFGENGIHQGGIVDVPQEDGTSEWWSVIFQDRNRLGRVPTLQPVYWETDENGLKWPVMGVKGQNGDQAVVTMKKPNTGVSTKPQKPADSDEFNSATLGKHWQWNHVSDSEKWSLTEREGYMRLYTATVTDNLTYAQNTLRQRVVGPESSATIKMDISHMQDGDVAGLSVIQRNYNYIGVQQDKDQKRVLIQDNGREQISESIPKDTKEIWFRAYMPRFQYQTEYSYSLDGKNFVRLGGRYEMHPGNYVGMGFGAFNYATKELGGYVDMDYFHMDMPDDHGNYNTLNEKIEAERYDSQSYDYTLGEPSREYNPLTKWTADYVYSNDLQKNGLTYDLALSNLREGDWVQFNQVDFKEGADWLNFRVAGTADGGKIEVRLNDEKGELLATVDVPNTENLETFQNVIVPIEKSPKNIQKLCLVYREGKPQSCQINWFMVGKGKEPKLPKVPEELVAKSKGTSAIEFSWNDVAGATEYDLKIGDEIISNVTSPFIKTGLSEGTVSKVCVRAKNEAGNGKWSDSIKVSTEGNPYRIPQSNMSIPKFSSEEAGGEGPESGYIKAILDGKEETFWHTAWSSGNAQPPHWFIVDLGGSYPVNKIMMLPRQNSGDRPNGLIQKYTLSYSNTGMGDGDFTEIKQYELPQGISWQTMEFDTVTARYLKVYVNESWNNFASLAEFEVFRAEADNSKPELPANVKTEVKWDHEKPLVELSWDPAADAESGIQSYSILRDGKFLDVVKETTYVDSSVELDKRYHYEIIATNGAGVDSDAAVADVNVVAPPKTYEIPQENMIATVSSEETIDEANTGHGFAKNVLDGDTNTFWCTQWSDKNSDGKHPGPHWIQIDLGDTYTLLDHVVFTQRNISIPHGQVLEYTLSYSEDGENFTPIVKNGKWDPQVAENTVSLKGIQARYLKLDCLKGQGGYVPAAMAEVKVYAAEKTLTDISVKNTPIKTVYTEGEQFDPTGLALELTYNDQTTETVVYGEDTQDDFTFSPTLDEQLQLGQKAVTVTYKEKAVTVTIEVQEADIVDKSELQKLVDQSKKYEDAIKEYTPATAELFIGALQNARDILAKEDATQEEIDAAYAALQNAIFGLRLIPNKDKLDELIKEAEQTDFSKYTEASGQAVKAALAHAKEVFADENATKEDVEGAEKELKAAMKELKLVSNEDKNAGKDNNSGISGGNNNGGTSGNKTEKGAPKTGDHTSMAWLFAMAAAVGVVFFRRRKSCK